MVLKSTLLFPVSKCLRRLFSPRIPKRTLSGSISKEEFASRRLQFVQKLGEYSTETPFTSTRHLVIIPAAEVQYMSLHVPHTFHQDSYFRYLTGILEPGAVLTIEVSAINSKSDFNDNIAFLPRLFVEERNEHDRLWDGPTMGVDMASKLTGIQETHPLNHLSEYLSSTFSQLNTSSDFIWFGLPFIVRRKDKAPVNRTLFNQTSELFSKCSLDPKQLQDPAPLLDELRLIKSPSEIALLRRAAEVTTTALKKTMRAAFPGIAEAELCTRFEHESRMMGSRLGYPAVVAGGPRANIIHYLQNDCIVEDNQLVLMDVGSEVEGYTADITRTWPVNGRFTKQQRTLHDVLVQVQRDCQQAASPDVSLQDLYDLMLKRIYKYLSEEKILQSNASAAMAQKICPHHVGHFLGLDVHDTPSIPYSRKFRPGMVFPLEPGIYFPSEGSDTLHIRTEFCGLGLRLEDDFVMTVEGRAEKLTNELSSDAGDLESYVTGLSTD
ncbi:Xaa-Pro aminopeptidase 3 [Sparganum proliferum]